MDKELYFLTRAYFKLKSQEDTWIEEGSPLKWTGFFQGVREQMERIENAINALSDIQELIKELKGE